MKPVVSKFLLPLHLEYIDGRFWRVLSAFTFGSVVLERVIEVPVGFVTNFASVPQIFWNILPPTGTYGSAAVIHDLCYQTPMDCTRAQADDVFNEAMIELSVPWLTRQVLYRGVQIKGGVAWRSYADARKAVTLS